jgi:hypothetical protein
VEAAEAAEILGAALMFAVTRWGLAGLMQSGAQKLAL